PRYNFATRDRVFGAPANASASVDPSTGRPYPLVRKLYLKSAPLATWKFSAMKKATNAKMGVQKPASRATPADSSPSGTTLANVATPGNATRCRYQLLMEPGPAACDHSCNVAARMDGLVNQPILPRPSNTKKTPMQMR